jgi:PEP-CTERM motif
METASRNLCKLLSSTAIFYSLSLSPVAAASLNEGFEPPDNSIAQLQSEGWTFINNSNPVGTQTAPWVIDNDAPPQTGTPLFPNSGSNWIGTSFQSGTIGVGHVVSDWMILPTMTFQPDGSLTFFTISTGSDDFPDRLQVLLSLNGSSSNVGSAGSTSNFGDFTNLLLDINPNYSTTYTPGTNNGYPNLGANSAQKYVEYSVPNLGQFAGDTGRIAFHYFLTDTSTQGSDIAVDDISVNNIVTVPEPSTLMLLCGGAVILAACVFRHRRRLPFESLRGVH